MIKKQKYKNILQALFKVNNQLKELEKKNLTEISNGKYLSPSEIITMSIIKNHPESNITEIATHLGVTKGAVSQVIRKLEEKQMIEKYKTHNEKEVYLKLLEEADKVVKEYEENCFNNECKLIDVLKKLDEDQLDFIQSIFEQFGDVLKH